MQHYVIILFTGITSGMTFPFVYFGRLRYANICSYDPGRCRQTLRYYFSTVYVHVNINTVVPFLCCLILLSNLFVTGNKVVVIQCITTHWSLMF